MKIVNVRGGLGNQMFQYAFALALKKRWPNEDVLLDVSHYHYLFNKKYYFNGYEIDKWFPNANLPKANPRQIAKVSYYIPNYILSRIGRKILPVKKGEMIFKIGDDYVYLPEAFDERYNYFDGYWQSIKYYESIKDEICHAFTPPAPNDYNKELIEKLESTLSVGIHVRRGDYVNHPVFGGICGEEYYRKALEFILSDGKKHTFFVFSNDIEWCRKNFSELIGDSEIVYVTENKGKMSPWDMFLMTYCKDLVIANSSFSWWGAYLNRQSGRIIAPDRWVNLDVEIDIYNPTWTILETEKKD